MITYLIIITTTFCLTGAFIEYSDELSELSNFGEETVLNQEKIDWAEEFKKPENIALGTITFFAVMIIGILCYSDPADLAENRITFLRRILLDADMFNLRWPTGRPTPQDLIWWLFSIWRQRPW